MRISMIVPTRNRANIWRTNWLTDALTAGTTLPDELVICLDHCDDDTLAVLKGLRLPFLVHIIETTAPRPEPFTASGIPDNCLFHAAAGDILLHIDDDIAPAPTLLEHVLAMLSTLPNASIWYTMNFTDAQHNPLEYGEDWRIELAKRCKWPTLPGGIMRPEPGSSACTGAIFAVPRRVIHEIGGHDLRFVGYHNQDTRLGQRLTKYCRAGSYICTLPELTSDHLGTTWHMQNRTDQRRLRHAYGSNQSGPTIANGGPDYWTSETLLASYRTLTVIDNKRP